MNILKMQRLDLRYLRQELGEEEYQRYRAAMRAARLWKESVISDKLDCLDERTPDCACNPMTDRSCPVCRTKQNEVMAGYIAPKPEYADYDDFSEIPF